MKVKLESHPTKKEFIPFSVTFTVNSIEEARLLFHIANHNKLLSAIKNSAYGGGMEAYSKEISESIPEVSVTTSYELIKKEIKSQGFEL